MCKEIDNIDIKHLRSKLDLLNTRLLKAFESILEKKEIVKARELSLGFGETILKNGYLQTHDSLAEKYFSFGLVLENGFEVFVDDGDESTPIEVLKTGHIFPVDETDGFEHVLSKHLLHMTAGARSIFLSPKISDAICFTRLAKKYGLDLDIPKTLYDEWWLLANLARNSGSTWRAKTLIISIERNAFFSEECDNLRHVLMQSAISHQKALKNKNLFDVSIATFLTNEHHKINNQILDHIKRVCLIGNGTTPGFIFASNDLLAPVELFKKIFIEVYGIQYAPHIIHPGTPAKNQPCYYPIHNMGRLPAQRTRMTSLTQLKEIKKTLNHFQDFLSTSADNIDWKVFNKNELSYFHHHPDSRSKISPSSKLPELDPNIGTVIQNTMLPFCKASPFFRSGCVAIKPQSIRVH